MGDFKTLLANLDDDYLVGMANKGIVKRAYKDMEAGDYKVLSVDGDAQVTVGGETVVVRQPLAESTCSCPSRTICRHVVLGILALKEFLAGEEKGAETQKEADGKTDVEVSHNDGVSKENGEEKADRKKEVNEETTEGKSGDFKEDANEGDLKSRLLSEISAFSLASLKKMLGVKQLLAIASQKKSGQQPKITYSSIVTVQLPKGGNTVKLLSPLEYSTCTCHKKEFCVHKAAAVLWCKLEAGEVPEEELSGAEELQEYAMGEVKDAARQMKGFLEELLDTGLARTSPDVLDYLDRLALISHNAKLANFEGYWRALHDTYGNYLKRKASFDVKKLMEQLDRKSVV